MMDGEKLMIWSTSSVKHGEVCMDASEDRLLEFIDDAIADKTQTGTAMTAQMSFCCFVCLFPLIFCGHLFVF